MNWWEGLLSLRSYRKWSIAIEKIKDGNMRERGSGTWDKESKTVTESKVKQ